MHFPFTGVEGVEVGRRKEIGREQRALHDADRRPVREAGGQGKGQRPLGLGPWRHG